MLGANRLYVSNQFKIRDDFKAAVERNFHADALNVDFVNDAPKVTADINSFVEERTRGLIKEILKQPLNRGTMMTIINTLYFKGYWSKRMAEKEVPTVFNAGCGDLQSEHSKRLALISRLSRLCLLFYLSIEGQKEGKFHNEYAGALKFLRLTHVHNTQFQL